MKHSDIAAAISGADAFQIFGNSPLLTSFDDNHDGEGAIFINWDNGEDGEESLLLSPSDTYTALKTEDGHIQINHSEHGDFKIMLWNLTRCDEPKKKPECCELSSIETYKVVAISTGHISERDAKLLTEAAESGEDDMVMARPTGFFIKFVDSPESDDCRHGESDEIKNIILWAKAHGFQMIEFDSDATVYDQFPEFHW